MVEDELTEKNKNSKIWQIVLIVGSLAVVTYILSKLDMKVVDAFILQHRYWGMVAVILLYIVLSATPIPAEPLTILTAAVYTPLTAALLAALGFTLGSLVEYFIGAKFSKSADYIKNKENMPLGLGKIPVETPFFQIFGRMIPGYGSKFVSLISGYYRIPLPTYIWTSVAVNLAGGLLYAYGGYQIFSKVFPNLQRP